MVTGSIQTLPVACADNIFVLPDCMLQARHQAGGSRNRTQVRQCSVTGCLAGCLNSAGVIMQQAFTDLLHWSDCVTLNDWAARNLAYSHIQHTKTAIVTACLFKINQSSIDNRTVTRLNLIYITPLGAARLYSPGTQGLPSSRSSIAAADPCEPPHGP